MSGYRTIPDSMLEVGRSLGQGFWKLVRNNFITHEERISDLEDQGALFSAGVIFPYGGAAAPAGWLLCDGSVLSRTTYADLFAIVGTAFNTGGEAGTDFRLPDMRGRTPIGAGTGASPALTARTRGASGGEETHVLTSAEIPSHTHAITESAHSHTMGKTAGTGSNQLPQLVGGTAAGSTNTSYATSGLTISSNGGDTAHNTMQPSTVVNFIIKA